MKRIHDVNFRILSEVDRVCKKNNVSCFLDSGTLLGAVRHQDFIPWDDDVDILVKREDLSRFLESMRTDLGEEYEVVMPDEYNGHFFDFIPRIELKNSQRRNPTEEDKFYGNKQNKSCVDVFILDKIPEGKFGQICQVLWTKAIYGLAMGHRYSIDYSSYSAANRVMIGVLSSVGKRMKLETIMRMQEKRALKYDKTKSKCRMVSNYPLAFVDICYREEWFAGTVELKMHGASFGCPAGYDEILTATYGDYMKLPPKEQQVPEHNITELKY